MGILLAALTNYLGYKEGIINFLGGFFNLFKKDYIDGGSRMVMGVEVGQ